MEDDNTCSLCMKLFTDPVSLPCGHGFCRSCVKSSLGQIPKKRFGIFTRSNSVELCCPLCREKVRLGPRGVDELRPNNDQRELLRRRTVTESSLEQVGSNRMEDANTCSWCMDVFTDPLSLPCGHGFCRGCLKSVVDHTTRAKTGGNTSSDSTILPCPLCRAEVTLGPTGVDELQSSQDPCELTSRYSVTCSAVTAPLCDMCQGQKKPADRYCTNCMALYCKECLSSLHPQRGPFGRHGLLTMEQYTLENPSHEAVDEGNLSVDDAKETNCTAHREPLTLFCGTCEQPICTRCVLGHDDHVIQNINTAYTRNKASLEEQIKNFSAIRTGLEHLQAELIATKEDVQTKHEEEYKVIEESYENCMKSLQDWRQTQRDKVDKQRDTLTSETLSLLKSIDLLIEETDRLKTSSAELLTSNKALFLLESKGLLARLQCHSAESDQEVKDKRQNIEELQSKLSKCDFQRCVMVIPEIGEWSVNSDDVHSPTLDPQSDDPPSDGACGYYSVILEDAAQTSASLPGEAGVRTVQVPKLKFTSSNNPDGIDIKQNGTEVTSRPDGPVGVSYTCVRTDGRLTTDLLYWEVEVTWCLISTPAVFSPIATAGVRQEGSDFSHPAVWDNKSSSVGILYNFYTTRIKYRFIHNQKTHYQSMAIPWKKLSVKLGFLLQTADRTLTVVDVDRDTRLFTFRDVDLSQALVPVVGYGENGPQVTFRLPPENTPVLPKTVRTLMKP